MSQRHGWLLLLIASLVIALSNGTAEAQKNNKKGSTNTVKVGAGMPSVTQIQSNIQQIDTQIQARQKAYDDAKKKLDQAQQVHHQASLVHKQQLQDLSQAKKFAAMNAKSDRAWTAARDNVTALQKEMTELRKQVVESIKEREDYHQAVQLHDKALAEKQSNGGSTASEETRRAVAVKVAETAKTIRTIEDVVMADRTDFKELSRKLKDAEAEVARAAKKAHETEENDPKVASAKVAFVRTNSALKDAEHQLAQAQSVTNGIQQNMQALSRQKTDLNNQAQALSRLTSGTKGNKSNSSKGKR